MCIIDSGASRRRTRNARFRARRADHSTKLCVIFLFIHMKLKNLGKQANYIPNYIYKKENTKGHSNIVSSNKRDPIQISYVVFGQLQV